MNATKQQLDKLFRHQDENWERYQALLPKSDDVELIVIKGHLIIEELLYDLAYEHCTDSKYFESARLSFKQLAMVTRSLVLLPTMQTGWEGIDMLNSIRNKLAHRLEPEGINALIDELYAKCSSSENLPERFKQEDTPAAKAKSAICFIIGQLSVMIPMTAFFERNKKIDLSDFKYDPEKPDQPE